MGAERLKEVTTQGATAKAVSKARRQRRRGQGHEAEPGFDEVGLLGLNDDELMEVAIRAHEEGVDPQRAMGEIERRLGWEEASGQLMASGPQGLALAQKVWGDWLGPQAQPGRSDAPPVQLKADDKGGSSVELQWSKARERRRDSLRGDSNAARRRAHEALSSGGAPLPHQDAIQASFGAHRIDGVQAVQGEAVDEAAAELGAQAFASGEAVAFTQAPDLFTAAHEAAHVIQQRSGHAPAGGLSREGDALEQHADAVAQRVVRGQSATDLLDQITGGRALAPIFNQTPGAIQLLVAQLTVDPKAPERIDQVNIVGRPPPTYGNSMGDHSTAFAVQVAGVRRAVEGQTFTEAILNMDQLIHQMKELPGFSMIPSLPTRHHDRIREAFTELMELRSDMPKAAVLAGAEKADYEIHWDQVALTLQEMICVYLEVRELIPMSTINVAAKSPALAGKGKGEAEHAALLRDNEKEEVETPPEAVLAAIIGLFDGNSSALVAAELDEELLRQIVPGLEPATSVEDRVFRMCIQHVVSIRRAFPSAIASTGKSPQEVVAAVQAQVMPLLIEQWVREVGHLRRAVTRNQARIIRRTADLVVLSSRAKKQRRLIEEEIQGLRDEIAGLEEHIAAIAELQAKYAPEEEMGAGAGMDASDEDSASVAGSDVASDLGSESEAESDSEAEVEEAEDETASGQPLATQIHMHRGVIAGVEFAGRPPSPFPGTMGAHTTAWIVHLDRVRAAIDGLELDAAYAQVVGTLMTEADEMRVRLRAVLEGSPEHNAMADQARQWVVVAAKGYMAAPGVAKALSLQTLLVAYLTYINLMPGATLESDNTDGHGEAAHRRVLVEFEEGNFHPQKVLRAAIQGLIDTAAAPKTPQAALALWDNHILTLSGAYPKAVAASGIVAALKRKRLLTEQAQARLAALKAPKKRKAASMEEADLDASSEAGSDHASSGSLSDVASDDGFDFDPFGAWDIEKSLLNLEEFGASFYGSALLAAVERGAGRRPVVEDAAADAAPLVDREGGILAEAMPAFVAAYRDDVRNNLAFLTEGEGHVIATALNRRFAVHQGGPPPGFVIVDNAGGGHCLIHALMDANNFAGGADVGALRGATAGEIGNYRGLIAESLAAEDIAALCGAAVGAYVRGAPEPGMGPQVRALIRSASVQRARRAFVPVPGVGGGKAASGGGKAQAPKKQSKVEAAAKAAADADAGGGNLAQMGVGALEANVVLVHVGGNHWVMAYRAPVAVPDIGGGQADMMS